jgi:phospholipase C
MANFGRIRPYGDKDDKLTQGVLREIKTSPLSHSRRHARKLKTVVTLLFLVGFWGTMLAHAGSKRFQHVVVIFQENRSPDNLFQGLCSPPFGTASSCSTTPTGSQYDILTKNWLDNTSPTGTTRPTPGPLANNYDPYHTHGAFSTTCDADSTGACRMDGAANDACTGTCPSRMAYYYVSNSDKTLDPYLSLATQYGWANYMFQTNQGPSFPAHLYIFGGTSAPSAADDAAGIFAAENMHPDGATPGCIALSTTYVELIGTSGENQSVYPCFEHQTMSDLFDSSGVSWKYYTPADDTIWTAPNAINHICVPSAPSGGTCTGSEYLSNVIKPSSQVLTDISNCNLPQVSWVIPGGKKSDHPKSNTGEGPSWVASIVNAIGNNPTCKNNEVYWDNTAIIITWDDWGGWYDHEPPTFLHGVQGDYQLGFRVPMIVVSAYTPLGYVDNTRMDFGTLLRFMEQNFGIAEGALNFADARSTNDLLEFFDFSKSPRAFKTIAAPLDANYFVNDLTPQGDPDDY